MCALCNAVLRLTARSRDDRRTKHVAIVEQVQRQHGPFAADPFLPKEECDGEDWDEHEAGNDAAVMPRLGGALINVKGSALPGVFVKA